MAERIRALYDHTGGTFWVCWEDPYYEDVCHMTDKEEIVLCLNEDKEVIAIEDVHFALKDIDDLSVKVDYDHEGKALTCWYGNPLEEATREIAYKDIVFIKNDKGRVIGVEKRRFSLNSPADLHVEIDTFQDDSLKPYSNSTAAPDR